MGLDGSSVFKLIPARFTLESLDQLFADYPRHDFNVRLWDGTSWGCKEHPRFTFILKNPSALWQLMRSPSELTLGEAFIFDDLDIEGDLEAAFEVGDFLVSAGERNLSSTPFLAKLLTFPDRHHGKCSGAHPQGEVHSRDRDRQAIQYHYDLPAEFYSLWLDEAMIYSSAYFENPDESLDSAQFHKMDYICRKLQLKPGEKLLDVGCGWGGLLLHAAKHYGVDAVGITLSVRQAEVSRERIRESGLHEHCRVEITDYRDLEVDRPFDKIVSVGMFEHVGQNHLDEYFARLWSLLKEGGLFLNSGIAASTTYSRVGPSFIERYVFPDGDLVPISAALASAESGGFEVRELESLREHYALTLDHWVRRLQKHEPEAERITDRTTYRIWRLYMAASAHAFRTGRNNLYHVLFRRALASNGSPPTPNALREIENV